MRPGGHELRREVVLHHQRERILGAVMEVVAERGYRATSVAQIIKRASVAKLKFYELFDSKEDAFLAAFDRGLADAASRVQEAATAAGPDLGARVDAGIGALLAFLEERPALARAAVLEAPVLGEKVADRREGALAAFSPLLAESGSGKGGDLASGLAESVLDGVYSLLYEAVLSGKPKRLTRLRPSLVEFALLPLLGPAGARAATGT